MLIWGAALLWMIIANSIVYAGVFFINGQLFSTAFSGFYANTGYILRVILCIVTFLAVGNVLFSKGFQLFDIRQASVMNMVGFMLVQIAIALIFSKSAPNIMLVPASLLLCASVYWIYIILES